MNNISLETVIFTIENLDIIDGDKESVLKHLNAAKEAAKLALMGMDGLQVRGRVPVDSLLGCMMAIENIMGKEG